MTMLMLILVILFSLLKAQKKLYIPIVNLSPKYEKLPKLLSKGF